MFAIRRMPSNLKVFIYVHVCVKLCVCVKHVTFLDQEGFTPSCKRLWPPPTPHVVQTDRLRETGEKQRDWPLIHEKPHCYTISLSLTRQRGIADSICFGFTARSRTHAQSEHSPCAYARQMLSVMPHWYLMSLYLVGWCCQYICVGTCSLLLCFLLYTVQHKITFPLIISLYSHQSKLAQ